MRHHVRPLLGALVASVFVFANGCSSSGENNRSQADAPHSKSPVAGPAGPGAPVAASAPAVATLEPDAQPDGAADPPGCIVVREGVTAQPSAAEGAIAAAPIGHRVLFLNRFGGAYYPGADNSSRNTSSLVAQAVQMPPYSRSLTEWNQLVAASAAEYAPYDITVTDVDPGEAPHVEVVVSGSPSMIGQPATAAGISPLAGDCSVIERSIVFAFDNLLYDVNDQMRVVTHEAGHSYGLDHEFFCPDTMSYLFTCAAPKHFQNSNQYCGEYSARACTCGGTQDTVQHLFGVLGQHVETPPPTPDAGTTTDAGSVADAGDAGTSTTGPAIALIAPMDNAAAPGNVDAFAVSATVTSTGAAIKQTVLQWEINGALRSFDCDAMPSNMSCARSGNTVTWTLSVGTGLRTWHVEATDVSGQKTVSGSRTLNLTTVTAPTGPATVMSSPAPNTAYTAGSTVPVRVDVVNDTAGISQVWLTWTAPSGQVQYPLTYLGGTTWGLDVTTSAGATKGNRTLQVTAYEPSFATVVGTPVTISLK